MKQPGINNVRKIAGDGIGKRSCVLNTAHPEPTNRRQNVVAAIGELDIFPDSDKHCLLLRQTHTLGLIIPFLTETSQVERLRGVLSVMAGSDYHLNLTAIETVAQRNEIFGRLPRRGHIDGLLIFLIRPNDNELHRIYQENIPTVLVQASHPDLPHIFIDDTAAALSAVEHLIELGHHKIAYIGDCLDDRLGSNFSRQRYQGYRQALETADIPFQPDYYRQGWPNRDDAARMINELLRLPDPPTALFASCDELALGVLEAACDLNILVPEELSIVGYGDTEPAKLVQLTTVRQNLFESGVQGVELLLDTIKSPPAAPPQLLLPTELIIRDTTAPPAS